MDNENAADDESFEVHKVILNHVGIYPSYIIVSRRPWTETVKAKKRNFPDKLSRGITERLEVRGSDGPAVHQEERDTE